MNKNDLIASVASSAGLSKSDATRAIESFLDAITNSLKRDEKVSIVGFGNFSVSHRKATTGRNPRTGETIQIKASNLTSTALFFREVLLFFQRVVLLRLLPTGIAKTFMVKIGVESMNFTLLYYEFVCAQFI